MILSTTYVWHISSLLLTTDPPALPRRDKESDGAPVSLAGRIDVRDLGSRLQRQAPKDPENQQNRATQNLEGLTYQPRTAETRQVYELILAAVRSSIGDRIIRSAADTVLEVLKTDSLRDLDKKKEIETVFGPIPNEQFSQLVNLSKKITDYNADNETIGDPDKEADIDEDRGIAVVFDEEQEEDFEIKRHMKRSLT